MKLILLGIFGCFEIFAACFQYRGVCQADWMQNLPDSIKQRPLNQLTLPGTHDSASYQLDVNASIPMEKTMGLNFFFQGQMLDDWLIRRFLEELTLTQSLNILEQLEQGIRAFDFRILYNDQVQEFFMSHSFSTVPVSLVLSQIRDFLLQHSHEIIVIQMNNDQEHVQKTSPKNNEAVSMVRAVLGDLLIPVRQQNALNATFTLQSLISSQKRVLFSFLGELSETYDNIWPGSAILNYWPNKAEPQRSLQNIETYLPTLQNSTGDFLNLIFFTVTPNQDSVLENLLYSAVNCQFIGALFDLGRSMNNISSKLMNSAGAALGNLNIVSVDVPSDDYVRQIVHLNLKD